MGLTNALSAAASGLRITQAAVDLTAKNVANVDTPGYSRKSLLQQSVIAGDRTIGVRISGYTREVSNLVQSELRTELGSFGYASTLGDYYNRLDQLFGAPGSGNALDDLFNGLTGSLSELATTPESLSAQTQVVADASVLAQRISQIGTSIQAMRSETERSISEVVDRINILLGQLEDSNGRIIAQTKIGNTPVELLDQRDAVLDELSQYLDLSIIDRDDGGVNVLTSNGTLLFDYKAARLDFDAHLSMSPESLWNADPSLRGVGTIAIFSPAGNTVDLIADKGINGGSLGGLLDLRDDILVEAQRQVDELAGALSRAFSDSPIAGTAATVGAQSGFDVDLSALLSGDPVTLTYTDNVSGNQEVVTFIAVNNPGVLPLSDDATARTDDTVFGIDFSAGFGSVATQIGTALGANFTVSDEGAGVIRILDDGAPDAVDIDALDAVATSTALADSGVGLPLFVDGGNSPFIYSGSRDGGNQLTGFANRIKVNPAVVDDATSLVIYQTSPATLSGDATRPQALLDRLTNATTDFSPQTGLGGAIGYRTTVAGFMQQIVTFQGAASANAQGAVIAQEQIVTTLQETFIRDTGVNVDEEMARLIELQNAYAANARVISVIDEMIDTLIRI